MLSNFENAQKLHENLLGQLKTMSEEKINLLKNELQDEHQQLIYYQTHATLSEQDKYNRLLFQNERQSMLINSYLQDQYSRLITPAAPAQPIIKNTSRAFFTGGCICLLAQIIINFLTLTTAFDSKTISGLGSVSIIIITAILTGLGVYDEVGRFGGAGSMVPISGFANSIVSAALEFKREGIIYGIGAKIFTIAGPVILYGTLSSVIIGLIYYIAG